MTPDMGQAANNATKWT